MPVKFKNNATALLAASVGSGDTTVVLTTGQGQRFPSLSAGDYFYGTLFDANGNYEVVKATARSTDSLTVVRAQDGTTALAFNAGDGFALRPVAAALNNFSQLDANNAFTGANSFSGNTTLTGSLTGTTATFSGAISSVSPAFTGTPTAPTASLGTNTTQIATTAFALANGVPAGAIMMWSGSLASIPSGWYLCNGSNGTPDLRNRFIIGAGSTYSPGNTGGSADATLVSHTHTGTTATTSLTGSVTGISESFNSGGGTASGVFTKQTGYTVGLTPVQNDAADGGAFTMNASHNHTFTTDSAGTSGTNANLPPYYALAFIMKA